MQLVKDFLYDVWYLFVRANRKYLATPVLPFFSLLTPIIFLVLFTQLFSTLSKMPGFPSVNYLQFALAGVLIMEVFTAALQSGSLIVDDLNSGILSQMLTTPVNRSAILLGRLFSDAFKVTFQAAIILVLGYFLGATFITGALGIVLIFVTVVFFGMAWAGVSLAIGLRTKSSETVAALPMVVTLPLIFTSTALVPLNLLPSWMRSVSNLNPISYAANAVRELTSTGFSWNSILPDYGIMALIAFASVGITLLQFRKITR